MKFLDSYIETALWSSTDDTGIPLDSEKYSDCEIAPETREIMRLDCEKFLEKIDVCAIEQTLEQIAHDFWLTRNRHGAGFWDGDYPKEQGKQLTDIAHGFGECNLYIGDDGKIYCE